MVDAHPRAQRRRQFFGRRNAVDIRRQADAEGDEQVDADQHGAQEQRIVDGRIADEAQGQQHVADRQRDALTHEVQRVAEPPRK